MPRPVDTNLSTSASNILYGEIDRLIGSTKLRLEQQRIHIRELRASPTELLKAQRDLRVMMANYRRLRSLREHLAEDLIEMQARCARGQLC